MHGKTATVEDENLHNISLASGWYIVVVHAIVHLTRPGGATLQFKQKFSNIKSMPDLLRPTCCPRQGMIIKLV